MLPGQTMNRLDLDAVMASSLCLFCCRRKGFLDSDVGTMGQELPLMTGLNQVRLSGVVSKILGRSEFSAFHLRPEECC